MWAVIVQFGVKQRRVRPIKLERAAKLMLEPVKLKMLRVQPHAALVEVENSRIGDNRR